MKGDPQFIILKYSTWLDCATFEGKILGAVIQDFLSPTSNYVPDNPLQYYDRVLVENTTTDFVLDNTASTTRKVMNF